MQFVAGGPDIPDALLDAHEEGRVVFFCGAGISYSAGLPSFEGLVKKVYEGLSASPNSVQRAALKAKHFDTAIGLLEEDYIGGREAVRRKLADILIPDLSAPNATATHEALLMLGKCRSGQIRLITTNFDRLFEEVIAAKSLPIERFAAPFLPVQKDRWNGLVYLHGLLSTAPTGIELDRLVISSGDFGLAYLTERWAAYFVSELFRNYIVCFVGYSINDPILRYMIDADRLLDESPPKMFAFASYSKGKEEEQTNEWRAKNVIPILYRNYNHHAYLHKTLCAWAETYRDGVRGKEIIVDRYALAHPKDSTQRNNFVGRMLWALSDKSGLPAKRFADFNPVPSLDWLETFTEKRFGYEDLPRFGVSPHNEADTKLHFSLICRPAAYDYAPFMQLASYGATESTLDVVMCHLTRWLTRHLGDPRLILWISQQGGRLNEQWSRLIKDKLDHLASLKCNGKTAELDEIRSQAPNAIPDSLMCTLWRLLLSGRVKSSGHSLDLYWWKNWLKRDGLTNTLRMELRDLLTPQVALKKLFHWGDEKRNANAPMCLCQLGNWELELAVDDVHLALHDLADDLWTSVLPQLLEDIQQLLFDALGLLKDLGKANEYRDYSYCHLPSISPHWQNRGFCDWVALIELLRDAWLEVRVKDSARAVRVAQGWFELPYPTFKRLALFAASQEDRIPYKQWVDWLLADNAWWLWSVETQREVCRLLVLQGQKLSGIAQSKFEDAILSGPPRTMFGGNLSLEQWNNIAAHSIWLYLAKLNASGLVLGTVAASRLTELSNANPQWRLEANEREEFSHWMIGTGDPGYEESRDVDIAPRRRRELVQWLRKSDPDRYWYDRWSDTCRTRFFHSLCALHELARNNEWPVKRWISALQVWGEEDMVLRSWRYAARVVQIMPDSILGEIIEYVALWMNAVSNKINCNEDILLELCRRILKIRININTIHDKHDAQYIIDDVDNPIINVTKSLINLYFRQSHNDNDLLPENIKEIFTQICNVPQFIHGRAILGTRIISLFCIDREWTEQYLLPLFDWNNPIEARAVWEGFLDSPRLYQPLLIAFKPQFLETAKHYEELGDYHRQQFVSFLTYTALEAIPGYSKEEFRKAIGALPQEGLEQCARALSQMLEGAAEQRENYWKNRVLPFLQDIWPKSRKYATPRIAELLAQLSISAGKEFPSALATVKGWLQPFENLHNPVKQLLESPLCSKFPKDALELLNAIVRDQPWLPDELKKCLEEIEHYAPELADDPHYMRLQECVRKRE